MKNINNYKICKAIVSLENEVDMLKNKIENEVDMLKNKIGSESPDGSIDLSDYVTNDGLATKLENYYTKTKADDKFVINDIEPKLLFIDENKTIDIGARDLCYGNGMFVAVGDSNNRGAWSEDGKNFTEGNMPVDSYSNHKYISICYGNGLFVTTGQGDVCAWSEDGKTFTEGTISLGLWNGVCYGNNLFVAVSSGSNKSAWSEDGKTFNSGTIPPYNWIDICYGNDLFVAVAFNGRCAWSEDGKTFTEGTMDFIETLHGICYGNGLFVGVGETGTCVWSEDGKTFTHGTISSGWWHHVTFGDGKFVTVSNDGKCAWSADGKTFNEGTIPSAFYTSVCYGNGLFVTIGSDNGKCVWSSGVFVTAKSFALKEETYTKTESDERYALKDEVALNITGDQELSNYVSKNEIDLEKTKQFFDLLTIEEKDYNGKPQVETMFNFKGRTGLTTHLGFHQPPYNGETYLSMIYKGEKNGEQIDNHMYFGYGEIHYWDQRQNLDVPVKIPLLVSDDLKNSSGTPYALKTDVAEDQDLSNYVTKNELSTYALKTELPNVSTLTTKEEFNEKIQEVEAKITENQDKFPNDIGKDENYVISDELSNYYTKTAADGKFVINDNLTTKLNDYYTKTAADGKFVINDYEKDLSFTEGTISRNIWSSVCYGNEVFVTVGGGKCAWSTDGKTFADGIKINNGIVGANFWNSVCYGNGMFVAVGSDGRRAWSTDGKTFTNGTISNGEWYSVCYGNGIFVTVSLDNQCAWSTDGKTFTNGTIDAGSWYSVCYGNSTFVAIGNNSRCAWSTDGKTFTNGTISNGEWRGVCYGNGIFVSVGGGKCAWSTDGKTFTNGTIGFGSWYSVCYGNSTFVAIGNNSRCAWSTDGKTFTDGTISNGSWYSVCYGNGMFVAICNNGRCAWSEYGIVTAKSFALKDQTYTKTESDERYTLKTELQQSMTITHLAPIDEELDINSFVIGAPVYMTGNVYIKDWENEIWNKSIINDSIDCIPSVKINGTWKEYLGICTHILSESKENGTDSLSRERVLQTLEPQSGEAANEVLSRNCGEIRFATHGDYLVKVSDSSKFNIGDTIYIDFGENSSEIKILTEDISLNTKIQRTTIGIITSILDETTVSVFKA